MPKISNTDAYPIEAPTGGATLPYSRESDRETRQCLFSDLAFFTGAVATKTTTLTITGSKAAGSTYSVTASGVNYTKTGDDGALLSTAALFNFAEYITITLNGVGQDKGLSAVWASATSFTLDVAVDNGDIITILS